MSLNSLFTKKGAALQAAETIGATVAVAILFVEIILHKNDVDLPRHINLVVPLCVGLSVFLVLYPLLFLLVRKTKKTEP